MTRERCFQRETEKEMVEMMTGMKMRIEEHFDVR